MEYVFSNSARQAFCISWGTIYNGSWLSREPASMAIWFQAGKDSDALSLYSLKKILTHCLKKRALKWFTLAADLDSLLPDMAGPTIQTGTCRRGVTLDPKSTWGIISSSFCLLAETQLWPPALLWLLPFHQYLTGISSLTSKRSAFNVFCNKLFPFLPKLTETPHELEGRCESVSGTQPLSEHSHYRVWAFNNSFA